MPAKNSRKQYLENGHYHIYNRGVEKRVIFLDQQDYSVFLSYLKEYLLPKDEKALQAKLADPILLPKERDAVLKSIRLNNFAGEITLLAYCLMPNHFHFFIKQKSPGSIDKFMNSLGTRYTMYFNKKYNRVGSLYQGVYKAVLVNSDGQLLQLSAYIHRQALALKLASQGEALQETLQERQPSSFLDYIGKRGTTWIHPEEVLMHFSQTNPYLSYESFIRQTNNFDYINGLTLEEEES